MPHSLHLLYVLFEIILKLKLFVLKLSVVVAGIFREIDGYDINELDLSTSIIYWYHCRY